MPKHCEYVQQLSYLKINISDIEEIIKTHSIVKQWAYIVHDKDVYNSDDVKRDLMRDGDKRLNIKEGDYKPAHIHLYLNFGQSSASFPVVAAWFKDECQYVNRVKGKKADMLKYLTHENAPNKYQYNIDDVKTNIDITNEIKRDENESMCIDCMDQILVEFSQDKTTYAQACSAMDENRKKITERKTIDYHNKTMKTINDVWRQRCQLSSKGGRDMQVVFIYGKSGMGKSVFAKLYAEMLCKTQGFRDYCESSADNDPMQDYMGEDILIMNDFRDVDEMTGKSQKLTNVLRMLDPHFKSSVESRFQNKTFTGKLILITSAKDPLTWFKDCKEQRWQFFRRINMLIEITKDEIIYYSEKNYSGAVPFDCGFKEKRPGYIERATEARRDSSDIIKTYIKMNENEKTTALDISASLYDYVKKEAKAKGYDIEECFNDEEELF